MLADRFFYGTKIDIPDGHKPVCMSPQFPLRLLTRMRSGWLRRGAAFFLVSVGFFMLFTSTWKIATSENGIEHISEPRVDRLHIDHSKISGSGEHHNDSAKHHPLAATSPAVHQAWSSLYSTEDSERLAEAAKLRLFKANGFKFCPILNGATFDAFVDISVLGGSVAEINPSEARFTEVLDSVAQQTYDWVLKKYPTFYKQDVLRYACYSAAQGANSLMNITQQPLLHRIDYLSYYSELIPSIKPNASRIPGPRRKYSLAYLLTCHDIKALGQVKQLVDQLDDGTAIILIHVDSLSKDLMKELERWIKAREKERYQTGAAVDSIGNVFLAQTSYEGMWGHISLVWMQVSGYWELLDLADWEYVINISGYDWPLRTSAEIYRTLNSTKHQGKEHVQYWTMPNESADRLMRPHFGRSDRPSVEWSMYHPPEIGLRFYAIPTWRVCKQHQWMMLTSEFIKDLRTNADALHFLAFMEHTWIPDEAYFCIVIDNHPVFSKRNVKDNKRYLRFNAQHPVQLTLADKSHFPPEDPPGAEAKYFFVRKVTAAKQKDLLDWIQINHIDKHDLRAAEKP